MPASGLDADVTAFLDAHIDSIPQLEILLLLHEGRPAAWSVEQIAARVYVEPSHVQPLLRGLQSRGLVEHHPAVERLVRLYRTDLIGVTRYVHAKASRSVLDFARAFDFKKDRT
jgi:DNA-binding IclR family transcriptional regulator